MNEILKKIDRSLLSLVNKRVEYRRKAASPQNMVIRSMLNLQITTIQNYRGDILRINSKIEERIETVEFELDEIDKMEADEKSRQIP